LDGTEIYTRDAGAGVFEAFTKSSKSALSALFLRVLTHFGMTQSMSGPDMAIQPTKLDGPYPRAGADVEHVPGIIADGR
jgi:hypothetical protein